MWPENLPSIAMQRTTFSPKCCCHPVSIDSDLAVVSRWVLEIKKTYRDLEDELLVVVLELEGVQNRGQLGGVEFHCAEEVSRNCLPGRGGGGINIVD